MQLLKKGAMYCSFKYGVYEGYRDERYFLDLTEESLSLLLKNTRFKIKELLITNDVNPDRDIKWLNVILIKE